jgi:hypothetical protein
MNKTNRMFVSGYTLAVVGVVILGLIVAAMIVVGLPTVSRAATYGYINTSGNFTHVTADSSAEAFTNATNRDSNSGVMLVNNTNNTPDSNYGTGGGQLSGYLYVNQSGTVTQVYSSTAAEAFANAINRDSNSGVMPINSVADSNMIGDQQ